MKKMILIISIIVMFSGCKTLTYNDLNPDLNKNKNLLRTIEPVVNIKNLEDVYSTGSYNTEGTATDLGYANYGSNNIFGLGNQYISTTSSYSRDDRVKDTMRIFDKEVKENIIELEGKNRGYIVLSLGYRGNTRNYAYPIISILTLGTVNLLGVPADFVEESLEVEVEIKDLKGNRIKRYTDTSVTNGYVAMYYGYHGQTIFRKLAASNIKKSLEKIREKINGDAVYINKKLDNQ